MPIIPDVDIEKLGDTYYMISSKQHMSPGMVILESKDHGQLEDHRSCLGQPFLGTRI